MLSLGQAARLTGKSKTTITRAIKSGRISAIRRSDGSYEIDPAELARVYEVRIETPVTVSATGDAVLRATGQDAHGVTLATPREHELGTRLAVAEAELRGLKDMVAELRAARDQWQDQASRLAITDQRDQAEPRSWWRRFAG